MDILVVNVQFSEFSPCFSQEVEFLRIFREGDTRQFLAEIGGIFFPIGRDMEYAVDVIEQVICGNGIPPCIL